MFQYKSRFKREFIITRSESEWCFKSVLGVLVFKKKSKRDRECSDCAVLRDCVFFFGLGRSEIIWLFSGS